MKFAWILLVVLVCMGATTAFGQYYVPYSTAPVYVCPPTYYYAPAPTYYYTPQAYSYPAYSYPAYNYNSYPAYGYPYGSQPYPKYVPGEPIRNFFRSF